MSTESDDQARRLAWHYLQVDQPDRALEAVGRLGGAALDDPDMWKVRGWALLDLERYDEAGRIANDATARWPEDIDLLRILGAAHAHFDRLAVAERVLLGAVRLEPDDPELLAQYAGVLMRGVQLDKAEQVLDLAARSDPDTLAVLRARINLAYIRGRGKEVRRLSEELLRRDAEDAQGHLMLGAVDLEKVRTASALERFGTAIRHDPSDRAVATAARSARVLRSPLAWPLLPFQRFGVGPTWVAAIVLIFGLRAAGLETAALTATGVWVGLCVYSWIAAPMVRRRIERERW